MNSATNSSSSSAAGRFTGSFLAWLEATPRWAWIAVALLAIVVNVWWVLAAGLNTVPALGWSLGAWATLAVAWASNRRSWWTVCLSAWLLGCVFAVNSVDTGSAWSWALFAGWGMGGFWSLVRDRWPGWWMAGGSLACLLVLASTTSWSSPWAWWSTTDRSAGIDSSIPGEVQPTPTLSDPESPFSRQAASAPGGRRW